MTPELKSRWITALRGGAFKQTRETLKDGGGYCCLGVLCSILKDQYPDEIQEDDAVILVTSEDEGEVYQSTTELFEPLRSLIGLSEDIASQAIKRNDGERPFSPNSFAEIADWLETVL